MRTCRKCGKRKELEEFGYNKGCILGRGYRCRACINDRCRKNALANYHKHRKKRLVALRARRKLSPEKRKVYDDKYRATHKKELIEQKTRWNCKHLYKITVKEYRKRMDTSDCCQICGKQNDLCYDHNHNTLEFRGVLCRSCNRSLGQLGDDIESIEKVLTYLKNYKSPTTSPLQDVDPSGSKRVGS